MNLHELNIRLHQILVESSATQQEKSNQLNQLKQEIQEVNTYVKQSK